MTSKRTPDSGYNFRLGHYHLGALRRTRDMLAREANRYFQAGDPQADFFSGDAEALDELKNVLEKVIYHAETQGYYQAPTSFSEPDSFDVRVVPAVLQTGGGAGRG